MTLRNNEYLRYLQGQKTEAQRIPAGDAPDGNGREIDTVCRGSALYGCVRGEADRHLFDSCKADQSEGRDPDCVKAVSGENCPVVLCEKTGKKIVEVCGRMFLSALKELARRQNRMLTDVPETAENKLFPEKISAILEK